MKSCSTCNRTYPDDTLAFCLMDGSVLSAPYDPATGKVIAPKREPSPPRTEVMNTTPEPEPLRRTQLAKEAFDLRSTITVSSPVNRSDDQDAAATPAEDWLMWKRGNPQNY